MYRSLLFPEMMAFIRRLVHLKGESLWVVGEGEWEHREPKGQQWIVYPREGKWVLGIQQWLVCIKSSSGPRDRMSAGIPGKGFLTCHVSV